MSLRVSNRLEHLVHIRGDHTVNPSVAVRGDRVGGDGRHIVAAQPNREAVRIGKRKVWIGEGKVRIVLVVREVG